MNKKEKQSLPAGYSGTPFSKKIGTKEKQKIYIKNMPENFFDLLYPLPKDVTFISKPGKEIDIIHFFTKSAAELNKSLVGYKNRVKQNGTIRVSRPEKTSKVKTNISEDLIRKIAFPFGFVDIKVYAVDEIWSALKLVIRKKTGSNLVMILKVAFCKI